MEVLFNWHDNPTFLKLCNCLTGSQYREPSLTMQGCIQEECRIPGRGQEGENAFLDLPAHEKGIISLYLQVLYF